MAHSQERFPTKEAREVEPIIPHGFNGGGLDMFDERGVTSPAELERELERHGQKGIPPPPRPRRIPPPTD